MSAGNVVVHVRLGSLLYEEAMRELEKHNAADNAYDTWDVSEFIRVAVRELIRKRKAGRKPKSPPTQAEFNPPLTHGCSGTDTSAGRGDSLAGKLGEGERQG